MPVSSLMQQCDVVPYFHAVYCMAATSIIPACVLIRQKMQSSGCDDGN